MLKYKLSNGMLQCKVSKYLTGAQNDTVFVKNYAVVTNNEKNLFSTIVKEVTNLLIRIIQKIISNKTDIQILLLQKIRKPLLY